MTDPGSTLRPGPPLDARPSHRHGPDTAGSDPIHPGQSRREEQLIALKGEIPHLPPTVGTPFFQSFFFGPFAGQPSEGAPDRNGPRGWIILCLFLGILAVFTLWGFLKP
jgi:hypothetical protein